MLLSANFLIPFLFGAVDYEIKNGGLCPYKCSRQALEQWEKQASFLGEMARHTSGIRLEFCTYADHVSFTVEGGGFDLLVDGNLVCHSTQTERHTLSAPLPNKGNPVLEPEDPDLLTRVCLTFPNCYEGRLYSLEIADDELLRRPNFDQKFLFLGDSITQGFYGIFPSMSYAQRVSRFYNADCIIQGVGGGYFDPDTFLPPPNFDPDRVFIAFGTNDITWGRSPEQVRQMTVAFLDKIKATYGPEKVICILPIWRNDKKQYQQDPDAFEKWFSVLRREEESRGFTVIDGQSLVPHSPQFYQDDCLHPNDLGFSLYTENLIQALEKEI